MAEPARLDRNTAAPLHRQVTERLLELASTTSDGERLPPEHELMHRFGVSRTTIRRATESLIEQGFLVRAHGKGTFVRDHPVTHSLDSLSPFFAVLEAAGRPPETELLEFGWERGRAVPEYLAKAGSRALGYRRCYRTGGRVHAVLHVQIAEPYAVGLTAAQFEDTPVLRVLERHHGIVLRNARYTIRTMHADPALAALIDLPEGTGTGLL
ncbi:MAG: GntR family transcriptional regulator, partial [Nocardioidaceae bacterium]